MPASDSEYAYDVFISYAGADRAWVEGYLLDALTQAGVRCHSEAAFALGVPRLLEFERAIRQSQRTLLVLSPAYLAEGFGQFTDLLAQSYGLETATWPVIPLILHPVELPPRLAMLTRLDATDPADWPSVIQRLCAELQRPAPAPAPKPPCPYPGMVPFSEADSDRFFGRDEEVQELLERLRLHPFITVVGPSGSGKSSLVFAGLVPALRKSGLFGPGGWLVRTLRPGETPLAALSAALGGDSSNPTQAVSDLLPAHPDACRLLLVVDQFEELFTLARADVEPFQQALLRLAGTTNCYVVLTVRADFYPDLMAAPLWCEIQAHRFEVLPLDEDGLRQATVRPAEDAGVFVETGLVERLLADAAEEPGVLPLLQETLVLLWERLERRFLPLGAYEALGDDARTGLQVAIARRADATLAGLTPEQQSIARRIFLRLVQFGEGRADTRRQQPVAALRASGDEPLLFDQTLRHLTDNRLLTLSGEEGGDGRRVDIAHESLIAGWPTLEEWLAERREAELTRRRLEDKAQEWVRLGQGSGGLLDEVELLEAERWLESPDGADLGYGEALPALAQASRAAQEEAAAQQRRADRFRMRAVGAIAVLIIVALGIGLWSAQRQAENQRQLAQQQEEAAATAQALAEAESAARAEAEVERERAEQEARRALLGQLAAQSQAVLEEYPQRSLLLAVEALTVTSQVDEPRVPAAEQALRQALASSGGRVLGGHEWYVNAVAISPDGHWLVTGSGDNTARLWDLTASDPAAAPIVLRDHEGGIYAVAISPDNHWLVTGSSDDTARLWDLTAEDPAAEPIVLRGHEGSISAVAISPDNHWLVTGSEDNTARLWNLRLDELIDLACRTTGRNLTREEWEQYSPGQEYRKTCERWPLEGEKF
jgi:cell division protein FtsB